MRKLALLLIIIVSLEVFAQSAGVQKSAAPGIDQPNLVVVIVVDQFRYDYLLRFGSDYKEGLSQLLTRGAVFANANYEHFPTYTSVGHAGLLTGAYPSVHGIIGNTWYDRETAKAIPSAFDDSVQQVGGNGGQSASPRNLLVSTLGDELKISGQGRNRVIGISLKDYSVILATGRMANAVYWFDANTGVFVSSSYYMPDLPDWVKQFNAKKPADRYKGMEWEGTRLPAEADPKLYGMLEFTPYGNELVEAMAEAAIQAEQLGRDPETDLLMLSFSSNDYVGHTYGPDSKQVRDISLDTDRLLGKLFRYIDAQVGLTNAMVVFTADHGVAPLPEINAERKLPGGRIRFDLVLNAVQKSLQEKYGEGNWISGAPEESIYLNWELIKSKKLALEEVTATAAQAAETVPHVFRVYTRPQLMSGGAMTDSAGRRLMHSFSARRGPDLSVLLEPYFFFGSGRTTHGSVWDYDTHVPLIFMGAGIKAGHYYGTVAINDVAPTLSALLGIATPSGSAGRILKEMFVTK